MKTPEVERRRRVLRYELSQRLLELRGGDVSRMVRALIDHDSYGFRVVGIRAGGQETRLYCQRTDSLDHTHTVHAIERGGEPAFDEIVLRGDLEKK